MLISTKGRYALRVMIDLAERDNGTFILLGDIAARQGISPKYLEQIMPTLTKGGYVCGKHGKGGGYRIARRPEACRVGDILRLTEGSLAPVSCLESDSITCYRAAECRTLPMWKELEKVIGDFLDGITLSDLMTQLPQNYVI